MSKSFKLVNGDLSISTRSLDLVKGQEKLMQDLSLHIRERIGTDPMTPTYGSTLDGGIINGQEITPFIGQILNPSVRAAIAGEVGRLVYQYQQNQLQKLKDEASLYGGKNTLNREEIIDTINSINIKNIGTLVIVKVELTTLANSKITLTFPLDTGI